MGVQNSSVRRLAVPDLTTTVLTLTVTGIGADSALGGGTGSKSGRRLISVVAMFLGALAGAALILHVHVALPLVMAAVLVVAIAVRATCRVDRIRRGPTWTTDRSAKVHAALVTPQVSPPSKAFTVIPCDDRVAGQDDEDGRPRCRGRNRPQRAATGRIRPRLGQGARWF